MNVKNRIKTIISKPYAWLTAGAIAASTAPHALAVYTDPAADINTAVSGAATGASTSYVAVATISASAIILGFVFWGLRKGKGRA